MDETALSEFIRRYMAMWHEADASLRRETVRNLFAEDAENLMKQRVARGLGDIYARVTRAHEEWVAGKGYRFEPSGNTDTHHNIVKFFWKMVPRGGGPAASTGLDVFVLRDDGRIRSLYQFTEPNPSA